MKIISFIVVLIEITKEANSLKCQYNEKGADPTDATCAPGEVFCSFTNGLIGGVTRKCIGLKDDNGLDIKEGCMNWPSYEVRLEDCGDVHCPKMHQLKMTYCYCKQNNCNNNCTSSGKFKKVQVPKNTPGVKNKYDLEYDECDSDCTLNEGDQVTDPAATETNATTAEDKTEDSKTSEKPDSSTAEDKGEDTQATEVATEDGKGEDSKATEKSEDATAEPESGTGATKKSGCQRNTNSFEKSFLFWILACIVT